MLQIMAAQINDRLQQGEPNAFVQLLTSNQPLIKPHAARSRPRMASQIHRFRGGSDSTAKEESESEEIGQAGDSEIGDLPGENYTAAETDAQNSQPSSTPSSAIASGMAANEGVRDEPESEKAGQVGPKSEAGDPALVSEVENGAGEQSGATAVESGMHANTRKHVGDNFVSTKLHDLGYSSAEIQRLHHKHAQTILTHCIHRPSTGVPEIWNCKPRHRAILQSSMAPVLTLANFGTLVAMRGMKNHLKDEKERSAALLEDLAAAKKLQSEGGPNMANTMANRFNVPERVFFAARGMAVLAFFGMVLNGVSPIKAWSTLVLGAMNLFKNPSKALKGLSRIFRPRR